MPRKKTEINPKRGERLKELLKERGMTEQELADILHYHKGHISFIASGKRNMTEEFARKIHDLFPDVRYEWLMGYDDYKTERDKELYEQKKERVLDLCASMNQESQFMAKISALEWYFKYYELKTVPPLAMLLPDELLKLRKELTVKHQGTGPFPPAVREQSLFFITGLFSEEKILGICTGSELIELADRLFEFADFEFHKFAKRTKKTLKTKNDSSESEAIEKAFSNSVYDSVLYEIEKLKTEKDFATMQIPELLRKKNKLLFGIAVTIPENQSNGEDKA